MANVSSALHAHGVGSPRGRAVKDHKHRLRAVKPYEYTDAGSPLLAATPAVEAAARAFWAEIDSVLRERGVGT